MAKKVMTVRMGYQLYSHVQQSGMLSNCSMNKTAARYLWEGLDRDFPGEFRPIGLDVGQVVYAKASGEKLIVTEFAAPCLSFVRVRSLESGRQNPIAVPVGRLVKKRRGVLKGAI